MKFLFSIQVPAILMVMLRLKIFLLGNEGYAYALFLAVWPQKFIFKNKLGN